MSQELSFVSHNGHAVRSANITRSLQQAVLELLAEKAVPALRAYVDGVPVVVTCRVLKLARQPYYRWLAARITDADVVAAYRANALVDAHGDDLEFGHRFLADEAHDAGQPMAERTAWRICSQNGWFSAFEKKKVRGKGTKAGPRSTTISSSAIFTADGPNRLWLADIERHEALLNRVEVEDLRRRAAAAAR
ncbi:hypothetical protein [Phytoactinopolyspora halophila]|uniref:hypothetical protein n=1 Tax=Phytoactinopolyspora halophila TaxID=1981511 RepID=UPI001B8D9DFA|nr:hypothetical protein [Phytoactinopolyspora halophila]